MAVTADADQLLLHSFDAAQGLNGRYLNLHNAAETLGWGLDRAGRAAEYLVARGYLSWEAMGGIYSVTADGVDACEVLRPNERRQKARLTLLAASYELASGDIRQPLNIWRTAEDAGLSGDEATEAFEYLLAKGFLEPFALGGDYLITPETVSIMEDARRTPDSPTGYFPPLSSLNISNSTFIASNVASPGAVVNTGDITVGVPGELSAALEAIAEWIRGSELGHDDKRDALSDVASLRSQSARTTRNPAVLQSLWQSVAGKLPQVAALSADTATAIDTVSRWVGLA